MSGSFLRLLGMMQPDYLGEIDMFCTKRSILVINSPEELLILGVKTWIRILS